MNALVTGGTGFVGGHLIEQLIARGDRVSAIVREGSNAAFVESLGARVVRGDLDDLDSLRAACTGCEVVYHSAARVEIVGSEEEFQRTTVDGTRRLVAACNEAGVRRLVYVSSCGVYHPSLLAAGETLTESTPTPEPPAWFIYGRAKYRAEQAVMAECRRPLEWVIVRLGYLYGPRNKTMHTHVMPVMRDDMMMLIGDASNEMAMVYVVDAARAIALAGSTPAAAGRILIAGPGDRVTQRDYFDALADGFGLPRVKKTTPYALAFMGAWACEYIYRSGPKSQFLRRSAVALTGLPQKIDCAETCRVLGWRPEVFFADGMRRTFEWYHREYRDEAMSAQRESASAASTGR